MSRVSLAPAEACNYQPYHHHLSCHCQGAAPGQGVTSTFLPLHLEYWVTTMGQQVSSVSISTKLTSNLLTYSAISRQLVALSALIFQMKSCRTLQSPQHTSLASALSWS